MVKDWLESFTREEKGFDSLSVFFETRLREALVQTGQVGMPVPNRARAAMCCDLLLKVPRVFGRYSPLVTHLVDEVLRCVYKDYSRIERRMASGAEAGERSKVDAQRLFREPAFFDLSETMRKLFFLPALLLAAPAAAQQEAATAPHVAEAIAACQAITETDDVRYDNLPPMEWDNAKRRGARSQRVFK